MFFNGQKRETDMNMESASEDKAILKIPGWDFVGFQEGCTIYTPWYSIERKFIKSKAGFEIHDNMHFFSAELSAKEHNTDKFSMHIGDVYECAASGKVEVVKLTPQDTWEKRFKDYTPAKAKELMEVSGPKFVTAARHAAHVTDNILQQDPKSKDALIQRLRALRYVGYKNEAIDKTEYLDISDAILRVLSTDYPQDPAVQIQKVWSAYFRKNKQEMALQFQKFYPIAPKNYDLYKLGAQVAETLDKPDAALGSFLKALEMAKNALRKKFGRRGSWLKLCSIKEKWRKGFLTTDKQSPMIAPMHGLEETL